jgi:hypothetical protein
VSAPIDLSNNTYHLRPYINCVVLSNHVATHLYTCFQRFTSCMWFFFRRLAYIRDLSISHLAYVCDLSHRNPCMPQKILSFHHSLCLHSCLGVHSSSSTYESVLVSQYLFFQLPSFQYCLSSIIFFPYCMNHS